MDNNIDSASWTKEHLDTLLSKVKDNLPAKDSKKYSSRVEKIDWSVVSFDPFSAEQCKEHFLEICAPIRKYKNCQEVMDDLQNILANPSKFRPTDHPDCPKRPSSALIKFSRAKRKTLQEKITFENPSQYMAKVAQYFKALPEKKRKRYEDEYNRENAEYILKLEAFKKTNFQMTKAPTMTNPRTLFLEEKLEDFRTEKKMNYTDEEMADYTKVAKAQWVSLSEKRRCRYIKEAISDARFQAYKEEAKAYQAVNPDFVPKQLKTQFLTKEEQRIWNESNGRPQKPPWNGYTLFIKQHATDTASGKFTERIQALAQKWSQLSDDQKSVFNAKASQLRQDYAAAVEKYKQGLNQGELEQFEKEEANSTGKRKRVKSDSEDTPAKKARRPKTKIEKAPKTALDFYIDAHRKSYGEKHAAYDAEKVKEKLAKKFEKLEADELKKYEEKAEVSQAKQRERENMSDTLKNIIAQAPRKPPVSGYNLFTSLFLAAMNSEQSSKMGMREAAERWRGMSDYDKKRFAERKKIICSKYAQKHAKYLSSLSEAHRSEYEEYLQTQQTRKKKKGADPPSVPSGTAIASTSHADFDMSALTTKMLADSQESDGEGDSDEDAKVSSAQMNHVDAIPTTAVDNAVSSDEESSDSAIDSDVDDVSNTTPSKSNLTQTKTSASSDSDSSSDSDDEVDAAKAIHGNSAKLTVAKAATTAVAPLLNIKNSSSSSSSSDDDDSDDDNVASKSFPTKLTPVPLTPQKSTKPSNSSPKMSQPMFSGSSCDSDSEDEADVRKNAAILNSLAQSPKKTVENMASKSPSKTPVKKTQASLNLPAATPLKSPGKAQNKFLPSKPSTPTQKSPKKTAPDSSSSSSSDSDSDEEENVSANRNVATPPKQAVAKPSLTRTESSDDSSSDSESDDDALRKNVSAAQKQISVPPATTSHKPATDTKKATADSSSESSDSEDESLPSAQKSRSPPKTKAVPSPRKPQTSEKSPLKGDAAPPKKPAGKDDSSSSSSSSSSESDSGLGAAKFSPLKTPKATAPPSSSSSSESDSEAEKPAKKQTVSTHQNNNLKSKAPPEKKSKISNPTPTAASSSSDDSSDYDVTLPVAKPQKTKSKLTSILPKFSSTPNSAPPPKTKKKVKLLTKQTPTLNLSQSKKKKDRRKGK